MQTHAGISMPMQCKHMTLTTALLLGWLDASLHSIIDWYSNEMAPTENPLVPLTETDFC